MSRSARFAEALDSFATLAAEHATRKRTTSHHLFRPCLRMWRVHGCRAVDELELWLRGQYDALPSADPDSCLVGSRRRVRRSPASAIEARRGFRSTALVPRGRNRIGCAARRYVDRVGFYLRAVRQVTLTGRAAMARMRDRESAAVFRPSHVPSRRTRRAICRAFNI